MPISEIMRLTAKEVVFVRNWVKQSQANKRNKSVDDQIFAKTMGSEGIALMGKCGEVIAARFYGVEPDWNIYIGSDQGNDLNIHDTKTEIKTSTGRDLIMNHPDYAKYGLWKPDTEICILVHTNQPRNQMMNIGTNTQFQIIGGIRRAEFFEVAQPHDYGYGIRLVAKEHQLRGNEIFQEDVRQAI